MSPTIKNNSKTLASYGRMIVRNIIYNTMVTFYFSIFFTSICCCGVSVQTLILKSIIHLSKIIVQTATKGSCPCGISSNSLHIFNPKKEKHVYMFDHLSFLFSLLLFDSTLHDFFSSYLYIYMSCMHMISNTNYMLRSIAK